MDKFWDKYPHIQADLEKVINVMKDNARNKENIIEDALLDLINSGGKLLRPGFLLISGGFGKYDSEKLCNLAAVVEMLHMATLVHDDIIDNTESRRGSKTIQSKYGKDYAVLMGDILFCRCFMTLSTNTSMENMKLLSEAIFNICTGEVEQLSSHYSQEVSVKKYLKRIAAKTAELFAMSCYVGAYESGCSLELTKILFRIGYDIGMAFQIIDDILDYTAKSEIVGKPTGNDLREGIYTLPLIYALKADKDILAPILNKSKYSDEDIKDIIRITSQLGGLEKAKSLASKFTSRAFKRIESLPENENKAVLRAIAENLLIRQY
jgi:heptaprenyl diphosphate synthase